MSQFRTEEISVGEFCKLVDYPLEDFTDIDIPPSANCYAIWWVDPISRRKTGSLMVHDLVWGQDIEWMTLNEEELGVLL